ncbi:hypothetical protein PIB30_000261 [Stylosanthes scabra]|uniref:Uncharacterized protein n=1 Tax=Stylosanthes scabra TaxID=79078 RepID=A0ABU6S2F9_9FABA|nr:hypothetical protein [Stylosanthes scabra]
MNRYKNRLGQVARKGEPVKPSGFQKKPARRHLAEGVLIIHPPSIPSSFIYHRRPPPYRHTSPLKSPSISQSQSSRPWLLATSTVVAPATSIVIVLAPFFINLLVNGASLEKKQDKALAEHHQESKRGVALVDDSLWNAASKLHFVHPGRGGFQGWDGEKASSSPSISG